jgi:sugar/nucleoside kinase (ribokinase family)
VAIRDAMKKYDLAVVGEIYVDHVLTGFMAWPQPGEEVFAQDYVQEVGGGAAITACALTRLGRSVSLIGAIGEKEMPWIKQRLLAFGVSSAKLQYGNGSTGVTVSVSSHVDRSFFTYHGANAHLENQLAGDALLEHMAEARHIHFAMPISARLADMLLDTLSAMSCTTSLDVGHQAAWLKDTANLRTCSRVDYLLPNEREANMICAGTVHDYLDFTRENRWPNGVVKVGAAGAVMRSSDGLLRVSPPSVHAVDTTGAGDAFNAGFIDGLLDGKGGQECLRRGCVCGALSTRAAGALTGLPTRDEFEKCLRESYG